MKLFRHGPAGSERAGVVDRNGMKRDLSPIVGDVTPELLAPERLAALHAIDFEKLALVSDDVRIGAPVGGIRQFVAIGLNYRKHAEESDMAIPAEPVVFNKALLSIAGPNDDVTMPEGSTHLDWEIELGIVIGSLTRRVSEEDALAHVAGYCLANDVSERHWQAHRNGQWMKGKSFDGFGPLGPWLVTTDELTDPQDIPLRLEVDGDVRQNSNTSDMIFSAAFLVSYVSQFMTLLPGDVVITGTPEGVGAGRKPPLFLKRGEVITLDGGILGKQRQVIV